ncbi:MAG: hypothetical protein LBI71_00850 [Enterobacteriaceae bacterium]|jgi:hypothetical protein|nr:hypothetical protein [Enterobacteriaceae bacterium]
MKPIITTIFSHLNKALENIHFDAWVYFRHKDESYYIGGNNNIYGNGNSENNHYEKYSPEKYIKFIEENVVYIRKSADHIQDEYFHIPTSFHQSIESIRLRLYINNMNENRIFMIIKLPDKIINENLIREVIVFIFRANQPIDELYINLKGIIYNTFNVENSFIIEKCRTKYTLFEELQTINNQQQGNSLRITVDKINCIIDLSKNKDLTHLLPSNLIIEFERPYYGWSEQAERRYSEVTARILAEIPKQDILRKTQSKFRRVMSD